MVIAALPSINSEIGKKDGKSCAHSWEKLQTGRSPISKGRTSVSVARVAGSSPLAHLRKNELPLLRRTWFIFFGQPAANISVVAQ
jgi:hypothetical protein